MTPRRVRLSAWGRTFAAAARTPYGIGELSGPTGGSELGIDTGVAIGAGVTAGIGVGAAWARASVETAAENAAAARAVASRFFIMRGSYPLRRAAMKAIVRSTASGASPT